MNTMSLMNLLHNSKAASSASPNLLYTPPLNQRLVLWVTKQPLGRNASSSLQQSHISK